MSNTESRLAIVIDSSKAEEKVSRLSKVLQGLSDDSSNAERDLTGLSNTTKSLGSVLGKNTKLSKNLQKAVQDLNGAYFDSTNRLHSADGEYLAMTDSMKKALKEVDGLEDSLKRQGKAISEASEKAKQHAKSMDNLKKGFESLKKVSMVTMVGLGGVIGLATKQAQNFEVAMAGINKTVDFAEPDGLKTMRAELQKLTTEIPQSFESLADIAATAGQLGIAEKDIVGFTETVAKMGVAFDMSAGETADSMAKIANVFGVPIANVGELGDTINALSNSMASTAPDIIGFMQRSSSLAKSFKLTTDETAAFGSAMVALGMQPEVASTAFNSMVMTLSDIDGMSKKGKSGLKQLGLDTAEFANIARTDGKGAIMDVLGAVNQLDEADRVAALSNMFGKEAAAKIASMATGIGTVNSALETTKDTAGSMQAEFESISSTSANKMQLFQNNMTNATASLGEAFIPVLNELMLNLTPVIATFGQWASANPELVTSIAGVVGGLAGLVLGVGGLISAYKTGKEIFTGMKVGMAMLGSPMGLVVLGIAAVVTAGYLLYKNWDTIKAKATELWTKVTEVWQGIKDSVSEAWEGVKTSTNEAWEGVKTSVSDALDNVKNKMTEVFDGFPEPVKTALSVIKTVFSTGFNAVKAVVSTAFKAIKALATGDIEGFKSIVKTGFNKAWNFIKTVFNSIKTTISTAMTKMVNIARSKVAMFILKFSLLKNKLMTIGEQAVQGLIDGIKAKITGAIDVARDLASKVSDTVKSFFDIHSPSRLFKQFGEFLSIGLAIGIKGKESEAVKAALNLAKSVSDAMDGLIENSHLLEQQKLLGDGYNAAIAKFNYDKAQGVYDGLKDSLVANYEAEIKRNEVIKESIALANKAVAANDAIEKSIANINRSMALGSNATGIQSLMYDMQKTDKYKNASGGSQIALLGATAEQDFSGMMQGVQPEKNEFQKLEASHTKQLEIIRNFESTHTELTEQAAAARAKITEKYEAAKTDLMLTTGQQIAGDLQGIAADIFGKESKAARAMFAMKKGFAIAQSAIAIKESIAEAMKVGFPQNIPLIAGAVAQGATIVSDIKSIAMPVGQAHDGIMSVPKSGTWNLEKGERVLPKHTAKAMDKKLEGNDNGGANVIINNYSNEKATAEKQPNGDILVVVGQIVDTKIQNWERSAKRQGGALSRAS